MTTTTNTARHVLVVGFGRSGRAAAEFLAARGARVTVNDSRPASELPGDLPAGVEAVFGEHPTALFTAVDQIVVSPGVGALPALEAARAAGVEVIGEIELAARQLQAEVVGITGTNGKSTTTTWVGEMLRGGSRPLFVGGNLGEPLLSAIGGEADRPDGVAVVELSSFQLETCRELRPRVGVLLNVAPDHLDRHGTMAEYARAKARLFAAQQPDDWAVLNHGDAHCRDIAGDLNATVVWFSQGARPEPGAVIDGPVMRVRLPDRPELTFDTGALRLVGAHNRDNAMAAVLAALLVGAEPARVQRALAEFSGLPHRMELVAEHDGVRYYDDSKATNVSAVVGSLSGFPGAFVLIAGGRDKGGSYAPLAAVLEGNCRAAVLIGEAAERIAAALDGVVPLHRAESLEAAVARARRIARSGEAVVLSPACSSYDMFRDFEERGRAFAAAARRTAGEGGA